MTIERFKELLDTVTVRDVSDGRVLVERMTREELSELITLAGERLGELRFQPGGTEGCRWEDPPVWPYPHIN